LIAALGCKENDMMRWASAIVLAVVLGMGVAAPAQAQTQRFGLMFGDERKDLFPERFSCMTDYQIREAVAAQGYSQIALNVPDNKHIEVRATKGDWVYLLDFNYCSGRIESRTQLRPAR
jgi:hypothetical protein